MIKILVADDHNIVRAGLCRLLETEQDFQVTGQAGNGHDAVKLCRELSPDVLLLDLDMPGIDGIEVTRQVVSSCPGVKVFVLTMYSHEEYAVRILNAGGAGFAVKGITEDELPDAIRMVAKGKSYISPAITEKTFLRSRVVNHEDPLAMLSEREMQVFIRLARGVSLIDISDELCLTESSVRTYKRRAMEKLGLNSLSDLIRFAIRQGLINKY